jgi:hypothetical protein
MQHTTMEDAMKTQIINGYEIKADEMSDSSYISLGGEFNGIWDIWKHGEFVASFLSLSDAKAFAENH